MPQTATVYGIIASIYRIISVKTVICTRTFDFLQPENLYDAAKFWWREISGN